MTYRVLSLFAGIGGFDLGLERTGGFKTVAFCEIDKAAQKVLRKHWPEVPCYDDVRTLGRDTLAADGIAADFICAGFPCQDISYAGRGAGLAGDRSGLFYEVARLIGELEPRWVVLENVSALLDRGLGDVLGTLASLGYDAEWHCIPASAIGAPHRRDRIWIMAYPNSYAGNAWRIGNTEQGTRGRNADRSGIGADVADANEPRLEGWLRAGLQECAGKWAAGEVGSCRLGNIWQFEPSVGRVANGVPGRVDRLKQLGNAVVPQIPELIGRAILAAEAA